jgi:hypothetical protein
LTELEKYRKTLLANLKTKGVIRIKSLKIGTNWDNSAQDGSAKD